MTKPIRTPGRICDLYRDEPLQQSKRCLHCLNQQRAMIVHERFVNLGIERVEIQCPHITNWRRHPIGRKVFFVSYSEQPPAEQNDDTLFQSQAKEQPHA